MHRERDERFFLYELEPTTDAGFSRRRVFDSWLRHASELDHNPSSFLELASKLDGKHFKELPPCRGSRALQLLSLLAAEQWKSDELELWQESEILARYRETYGNEITRECGRHDLEDRLLVQGLAARYAGKYFIAVKGFALYIGCLAKYSTILDETTESISDSLVEWCDEHHARIAGGSSIYLQ
jgi:hypothetical protein